MEMSKTFNHIRAYARSKHLPIIPIDAKDVSLIQEPDSFYRHTLRSIETAESRLALSALYLGTGFREKALVKSICNKVELNKSLRVNVILDANRATRLDEKSQSSVSMLKQLLSYDNVNLGLIRTNNSRSIINRFMQKFQKLNELSATYHAKVLVSDNNLIITGANLSSAYFDKRQDRYMVVKNSEHLSAYMLELLDRIEDKHQPLKTSIQQMNELFTKRLANNSNSSTTTRTNDSYVIPLVQHGSCGITDLEDFLTFLNSILPDDAKIHLSSGYFNPSPVISKLTITSVLAPAERANGFFGGKGVLRHVPRIYSALQRHYLKTHKDCELFLYDKTDWSYHAKGIWIEGLKDFYVHLIGSSNFNCRSSHRDLEAQLVILTTNENLMTQLSEEHCQLKKEAKPVELDKLPSSYSMYSILSKLIKSYL